MSKYSEGDLVWMTGKFGFGIFNGHVISSRKGLFGTKYLLRWGVTPDFGGTYERVGWRYEWRIWQ